MAIRHKNFPISAVQFHPESILTEVGEQIVSNFINEYNNFPWVIYWQDKYNYHIHPHLNQLMIHYLSTKIFMNINYYMSILFLLII